MSRYHQKSNILDVIIYAFTLSDVDADNIHLISEHNLDGFRYNPQLCVD